jgi:nitrite reductase (NO-forming)
MPATRSGRAAWHRPANAVVVAYLCATIAVAAYERSWPPPWLLTHVFLLGAATNAIVIWTAHFTTTLLPAPTRPRAHAGWVLPASLVVLNAGVLLVLVSVPHDAAPAVVLGAALVTAAVASRAVSMVSALARSRAARFGPVVRFYCAAAVALTFGIAAGAALEVGVPTDWYARVYAAHVQLNIFGWVSLTVLGTQAVFWPMVLRTRMVVGVENATTQALPLCAVGLSAIVAGLLAGSRVAACAGICLYIVGAVRGLEPFARTALQRTPRSPAALMLGAAVCWFVGGLAADLGKLVAARDLADYATAVGDFVPWLVTGFVVQVVIGALTYLLPVVLGGGPTRGRRLSATLDRYGLARLVVLNAGVLLVAASGGGVATAIGWSMVGLAVAAFCLLAAAALSPTALITAITKGRRRSARTGTARAE